MIVKDIFLFDAIATIGKAQTAFIVPRSPTRMVSFKNCSGILSAVRCGRPSILFMGHCAPKIKKGTMIMNTNANTEAIIEKMSNNANTLTAATDGKGEISWEALIGYLKKNLDLLCDAGRILTIAEAEEIMTELGDLECVLSGVIQSRIPCNRLVKVEGKFYLLVTPDDNGPNGVEPNGVEKKLRAILAVTFLEGLEGYAAQMLAETREEEVRLADLAENPVYGDDTDDLARAVEYATERREALGTALAEIRQLISIHGGKATATEAGLDSAVIESLATACMANGAGRAEGSDI